MYSPVFRVSIYELGYNGNIHMSNAGTVHHTAYGSTLHKKIPATNLNDENGKAEVIHQTSEAPLGTNSKASQIVYTGKRRCHYDKKGSICAYEFKSITQCKSKSNDLLSILEIPISGTVIGMCRRHRDGKRQMYYT